MNFPKESHHTETRGIILSGSFFDLTNYILAPVTIHLWSSHDENALIISSMILRVCNSPYTVQMSKVSCDAQGNLLLPHLVKSENKLHLSNIQWQRIPLHILMEGKIYSEGRLDQGKKPSRPNDKKPSRVSTRNLAKRQETKRQIL